MGFVCKTLQAFSVTRTWSLTSFIWQACPVNLVIILCDTFNTLSGAPLVWEIFVQEQLSAEAWCTCEVALVHLTDESFSKFSNWIEKFLWTASTKTTLQQRIKLWWGAILPLLWARGLPLFKEEDCLGQMNIRITGCLWRFLKLLCWKIHLESISKLWKV